MVHSVTYSGTLLSVDGRNTAVEVAASVIDEWNVGKRVPVVVDVNGFVYRSTVVPMHGQYLIPFASDKRKATGLSGGDPITVTLTHDIAERTVEIPVLLAEALAAGGVRDAFDAQSYTLRKEAARQVTDAKKDETRDRRIAAIVAKLIG